MQFAVSIGPDQLGPVQTDQGLNYQLSESVASIVYVEGWAQDYGNSNIFLKPLFRGNLDPFVNNANLGAIAHTSNGT